MLAIFSEIVAVVIILLVIPATNATSERTFSALHRMKTYLRSTMTQTRRNNTGLDKQKNQRKIVNIFIPISLNICNEPSH